MGTQSDMLEDLRTSLRELFTLQAQGSTFPRLSKAQGFVDGYMKALLDSRLASQAELLRLVAEVREATRGPATRTLDVLDAPARAF